jgi:hypothetical protein
MGTGREYNRTIDDEIIEQSPIPGGWICEQCVHYIGPMKCEFNIFIAFVGANMKKCRLYEQGRECKHCHKFT